MTLHVFWIVPSRPLTVEATCPVCHTELNQVTTTSMELDFRPPQAGDLTICAYCETISVFEADGSMRVATTEECERVPDWVKEHTRGSVS